MEGEERKDSRPLILTILAGFLLLSLIETTLRFPIFYSGPLIPPFTYSTLYFIWTTSLGFLVSAAVFGVLAMTAVAEGHAVPGSALDRFGRSCFFIVMFGLLALLALYLFNYGGPDAALFAILELGLLAVFVVVYLPGPRSGPRPPH